MDYDLLSRIENLEVLYRKNHELLKQLNSVVSKYEKRFNDIEDDMDSIAGSVDAINEYIDNLQEGFSQFAEEMEKLDFDDL